MASLKIHDLMNHLAEFFAPEKAAGVSAVVQFEISGAEGGEWLVRIEDNRCRVSRGKAEAANLIFYASAEDVMDIFYNRLDPMQAYLQGRLRLKGNFGLALRLFDLFDMNLEKLDALRGE